MTIHIKNSIASLALPGRWDISANRLLIPGAIVAFDGKIRINRLYHYPQCSRSFRRVWRGTKTTVCSDKKQ